MQGIPSQRSLQLHTISLWGNEMSFETGWWLWGDLEKWVAHQGLAMTNMD
jgi:hypothetical protein